MKRQSLGLEGKIVGRYDDNPIMNSMIYEVELPESQVKDYAENVIARNMLSQVYDKGYSATLVDSIVYYKRDNSAVENSDKYVVTRRGQLRLRKTIQGWEILDAWRDGSETWVPLKDMKESNPVDVVEFVKAKGINDDLAFV